MAKQSGKTRGSSFRGLRRLLSTGNNNVRYNTPVTNRILSDINDGYVVEGIGSDRRRTTAEWTPNGQTAYKITQYPKDPKKGSINVTLLGDDNSIVPLLRSYGVKKIRLLD